MDRSTAALDRALAGASFVDDPYPVYQALREHHPIHWSDAWGVWVVTRYADVLSVMRDADRFSNAGRYEALAHQLPEQQWADIEALIRHNSSGMLQSDPPDHTRMRVLVRMAFTPRVIEGLRGRVTEIVYEYLDRVAGLDTFDLMSTLAGPLPITVVCELLGIPTSDQDAFMGWATDIAGFQAAGGADYSASVKAARAVEQLEAYFESAITERRVRPRNDLMSALVEAEDKGDRLSHAELVNMCALLLNAGHETTRNLIGNAMLTLLRDPESLLALRTDDTLMPTAIEECLRYESPVQRGWRVIKQDTEFLGEPLQAGQLIFAMLGAANRDPLRFPQADAFDIRRADNRHLAFGYGIHFCIGAPLSRLEAPIALRALMTRYPRLELAQPPSWNRNIHARGLGALLLHARTS